MALVLAGIALAVATSGRQSVTLEGGDRVAPVVRPAPPFVTTPNTEPPQTLSATPEVVRRIPASPMTGLEIPALGRKFNTEGVSLGAPIDPPFNTATVANTLYYESDHSVRGANPGTDTDNTVYVTGHTWRGGDAAMNVIDRHLRVGDELLVTTARSERLGVRLRYVVRRTSVYQESSLPGVSKLWEVAPGRLVIITCNLRDDGGSQTHTRVFYAELTGITG